MEQNREEMKKRYQFLMLSLREIHTRNLWQDFSAHIPEIWVIWDWLCSIKRFNRLQIMAESFISYLDYEIRAKNSHVGEQLEAKTKLANVISTVKSQDTIAIYVQFVRYWLMLETDEVAKKQMYQEASEFCRQIPFAPLAASYYWWLDEFWNGERHLASLRSYVKKCKQERTTMTRDDLCYCLVGIGKMIAILGRAIEGCKYIQIVNNLGRECRAGLSAYESLKDCVLGLGVPKEDYKTILSPEEMMNIFLERYSYLDKG